MTVVGVYQLMTRHATRQASDTAMMTSMAVTGREEVCLTIVLSHLVVS